MLVKPTVFPEISPPVLSFNRIFTDQVVVLEFVALQYIVCFGGAVVRSSVTCVASNEKSGTPPTSHVGMVTTVPSCTITVEMRIFLLIRLTSRT